MYESLDVHRELCSYYPSYLLSFAQVNAIIFAQSIMLENAKELVERFLLNQFVLSADTRTLSELEYFLGIEYRSDRSENQRRALIISHFSGNGKVSLETIKEILKLFSGENASVSYMNSLLSSKLFIDNCPDFSLMDCLKAVRSRIPAHIKYLFSALSSAEAGVYAGNHFSEFIFEEIS